MEAFISFYDKCRLCLAKPGVINIFKKHDFPEDIYVSTGVKVHPLDNLPKKICETCHHIVTKAKQLRILAAANEIQMRNFFNCEKIKVNDSHADQTSQNRLKEKSDEDDSSRKQRIYVRQDIHQSTPAADSSSAKKPRTPEKNTDGITSYKETLQDDGTVHYECSICFKSYDKWKKFYLHQRLHNRTIVCPLDECGKKFATKGDLEKHFRSHSGERPYECDQCDKCYTQNVTLKLHKEAVHGTPK